MKKYIWVVLTVLSLCGVSAAKELVATDFRVAYLPLEQLQQVLAENGLTVVCRHQVAGNEKYTSLVYTSDDLKKLGAKQKRGFVSVLRILHNEEKKEVLVSNPEYYIRAFFQKKYEDDQEAPVVKALQAALGEMTATDDGLPAKKLAKYNFMMGMPHYDNFVRVAKGETAALLKKLETNAGDRLLFKIDIKGDGSSMLCGVALPGEIEKFNEKLGTMGQSHLLPYTVLIENGEANILHAKYYLALSFPQLTMKQFMKIMSVPGDIVDAFKADFK